MTRDSGFKQRVRARMAKTGESYSSARARLDKGGSSGARSRVLHITNGDSVAGTLREAGVPGKVLAWQDVLHDGPVPADRPAELRTVRSEHLAARWREVSEIEGRMAARDRQLEEYMQGEYVLWFEADVHDQLQLVQVLDALYRLGVDPARITLVSLGEYRGIAHFGGLGELRAEQLAPLLQDGQRLSTEALGLAAAAWAAFTAPDPGGLAAITRARSPELRYLGEAFARLREEYPSRTDGLSLTQRRILIAATEGEAPAAEVFKRVWYAERRPFLADALCWALIQELADCPAQLLEIDDLGLPFRQRRVRLAPTGDEVLAGRLDHVRRNGIDRWIGGVHLAGHSTPWRYDERLETLIPHDHIRGRRSRPATPISRSGGPAIATAMRPRSTVIGPFQQAACNKRL